MALLNENRLRAMRRFLIRLVAVVILVPASGLAAWTWITLKFVYASGDRSGYVQKLSKKGWFCKTWEGELAMANLPGAMPQIFEFTVRDESVAAAITKTMGDRVSLHYEQHREIPFACFGDTEYFITEVTTKGAGSSPSSPETPPAVKASPKSEAR